MIGLLEWGRDPISVRDWGRRKSSRDSRSCQGEHTSNERNQGFDTGKGAAGIVKRYVRANRSAGAKQNCRTLTAHRLHTKNDVGNSSIETLVFGYEEYPPTKIFLPSSLENNWTLGLCQFQTIFHCMP